MNIRVSFAVLLAAFVLVSLARGSPTLTALSASPADVLSPSPPKVIFRATSLGLPATGNVDAMKCGALDIQQSTILPTALAGH